MKQTAKTPIIFYLKFYLLITLLLNVAPVWAQDLEAEKQKLEQERQQRVLKIKEIEQIIDRTLSEKVKGIDKLNQINAQIYQHERLMATTSSELEVIERQIDELQKSLNRSSKRLDDLNEEYASLVYLESKSSSSPLNKLGLLFSVDTYNQLSNRINGIASVKKEFEKLKTEIEDSKKTEEKRKETLEKQRLEKLSLINNNQSESQTLRVLRKEQSLTLDDLKKHENTQKANLLQQQLLLRNVEIKISKVIQNAVKVSTIEDKKTGEMRPTPEVSQVSTVFSHNKNTLPWPVKAGFITNKFGKQPHPTLQRVVIENLGIDIRTNKNESVWTVAEGKVVAITQMSGMGNIVVVQHGEYFTVYAKLTDIKVKQGDKLKVKTEIGKVQTDTDGKSELQFQVWKNQLKLDPEEWLARQD